MNWQSRLRKELSSFTAFGQLKDLIPIITGYVGQGNALIYKSEWTTKYQLICLPSPLHSAKVLQVYDLPFARAMDIIILMVGTKVFAWKGHSTFILCDTVTGKRSYSKGPNLSNIMKLSVFTSSLVPKKYFMLHLILKPKGGTRLIHHTVQKITNSN